MTKMTTTLWAAAGVVLCMLVSSVAMACAPLPGPNWDVVPQEGGKGIAIGRIISITPNGRDELFDFAVAEVETLEVLQGAMPERFSLHGVTEQREHPTDIVMWCGRLMSDQSGDVVMAVEAGEGRYRLLFNEQIASPYLERMQSYAPDAAAAR